MVDNVKNPEKTVNKNLKLFFILQIFAKRVFFPLAAIYYVEVAGFSVKEVLLVASFYYLVSFLAEIPTGYFADRVSRVMSIRIGAILNIVATLLYVFVQNKFGIFAGNFFEAIGYSFIAGAGEALIYESLLYVKKEHDYSRIVSRGQSYSLYINAVLIALVPMTYNIDKRLPFVIGTLAYIVLGIASLYMKDIRIPKDKINTKKPIRIMLDKKGIIPFAIFFGIIGSFYYAQSDMNNLILKDLGVTAGHIGWIFAIASVFGAIIGRWIHLLKNIRVEKYVFIDGIIMALPMITVFTKSYLLMAIAVIVQMAFWRYRKIIYQDYLLTIYQTTYKATLLSAMNNIIQVNLLWVPIMIGFVISQTNLQLGLGIVGISSLFLIPFYLYFTKEFFKNRHYK